MKESFSKTGSLNKSCSKCEILQCCSTSLIFYSERNCSILPDLRKMVRFNCKIDYSLYQIATCVYLLRQNISCIQSTIFDVFLFEGNHAHSFVTKTNGSKTAKLTSLLYYGTLFNFRMDALSWVTLRKLCRRSKFTRITSIFYYLSFLLNDCFWNFWT